MLTKYWTCKVPELKNIDFPIDNGYDIYVEIFNIMISNQLLNQTVFKKTSEKLTITNVNESKNLKDVTVLMSNGKTFNLYVGYKSGFIRFLNENINKEFDEYLSKENEEERKKIEKKMEKLKDNEDFEIPSFSGRIDSFRNEYYFLSNFYPCDITYKEIAYKNNEAAFQAQKDLTRSLEFSNLEPEKAKRLGRKVNLRKDWEQVKVGIMKELLRCKFDQNPSLKEKLLETGNKYLAEGNSWDDKFWGVNKKGIGQNNLGILLMKLRRDYLKEEKEKEVNPS